MARVCSLLELCRDRTGRGQQQEERYRESKEPKKEVGERSVIQKNEII